VGGRTRVGITGSSGFLGWHLRTFLYGIDDIEVVPGDRQTFSGPEQLDAFVRSSDVIIHLAAMNRGADEEVFRTNLRLTGDLIVACERSGHRPHIVFASSTHIYRDTAYGRAKRICAEKLAKWAAESGGQFTNLILPNIFGEGGRPFYNSVVATFSHQLATGEASVIHEDRQIELIHAQEVVECFLEIIRAGEGGDLFVSGKTISVQHLLEKLSGFFMHYEQNLIPELSCGLDLQLFNTLRSYLFPGKYPVRVAVHRDARGELFEAVKSFRGGQVFLSTTRAGVTRGNHYHRRKIERFMVLEGTAELKIRKLLTPDTSAFSLDGREPQFVDIPTLHTHAITNTGSSDLLTLFWASEVFDPADPDSYPEAV
jgi:UDP-2-acetamido-2,6-beta-L-arabino-hexul-4-ose reductase